MATRLDPDTNDASLLETLASVPAGTAERLRVFQAERRGAIRTFTTSPADRPGGTSSHAMVHVLF